MKCLICGCTQSCGCYHNIKGPCAWHADKLCTHCANPELFLETLRRPKSLAALPALTPFALRAALLALGHNCIISNKYARGVGTYSVMLKFAHGDNTAAVESFIAIMKAWFPHHDHMAPGTGTFYVRLDQSLPQLQAKGEWP